MSAIKNQQNMTKKELTQIIAKETGVDKNTVLTVVEAFMAETKNTLAKGESLYLRGFATFYPKHKAAKKGRNISKNTTIEIPEHYVPGMKPCKEWCETLVKE